MVIDKATVLLSPTKLDSEKDEYRNRIHKQTSLRSYISKNLDAPTSLPRKPHAAIVLNRFKRRHSIFRIKSLRCLSSNSKKTTEVK
ncbi:hypothetical protein EJB05_27755 [Eragrostis curvula]|uniref:Uncharacterized protein n=1 Tax=Eragrostis curvula TaxID=38414 RepID=A0A5J9UPC9_9POAL|nr:hypothetical protein EJB05_27755 [Eragrostis curvula]